MIVRTAGPRPAPKQICSLCARPYWDVSPAGDGISCAPIPDWEYLGLKKPADFEREIIGLLISLRRALARRARDLKSRPSQHAHQRPGYAASSSESYAKIKARCRIEDEAGQLTHLRPSGRNLKGSCPFHLERTPSFVVFPESQRWKCFGACGEGGDVIDLLRKAGRLG